MEKYKLFLQLFTEGDDGGTGDGNGDGSGTGGNNEPMSFDDFLGQEGNQAEFDRRVNKAIKTAVANEKEKWKTLTDDKLTEAEKLAKMTKEEKAEYRAKKAEKELEDLKKMEEEGMEILTCGTCLKHYGLMEKLMVGKVTDMYTIAERMTGADKVIRP